MEKSIIIVLILTISLFSFSYVYALDTCARHIYNNSNQSWTFEFQSTDDGGNVTFQGGLVNVATIAAGAQPSIYYNGLSGYLEITDRNGLGCPFNYAESGDFDSCAYIAHHGGTGSVIAVNDPSNGDIHMMGDDWGGKCP